MAITRIKTNQITDLNVTTAKLANQAVTGAKLANNLSYGSDFTVTGNLTVSGTTTSVSTTNTRVEDAIIALSSEATGSASVDSGLLINRGADDNYALIWDESEDQFVAANVGSEDGDTAGNVTISSYAGFQVGALTSTSIDASGAVAITDSTASSSTTTGALKVTGGIGAQGQIHAAGFTGDLTGNADTASALATARTISIAGDQAGSASFDGSGDVTITVATQNDSVDLGTHTTGNYVATIADAGNSAITVANSGSESAAVTLDIVPERIQDIVGAMFTTTNTESGITLTYEDSTGDIDVNVDDFTITLAGDLSGSVTVTDLANATLTATIAADSVALGTDTTGNYVGTITGGAGISSNGATTGEDIDHSLSIDLTDTNIFASDGTVSRAVVLDGSGDFTANLITADIDGIVGANTPAAGTFTTLTANTSATLASAKVSDLTSGRIVLAGTAGELEDSASLTFNGSTLAVTGAATISTTLGVTGTTSLNGAVNLGDASGDVISVNGTATFAESADFDGGFTVAASQTIDVGANAITNVADPSSAQHAATKAYVDSSVSSASSLTISDGGTTDAVIVGTNTLTFAGTANEITTTVTDNQVQIGLPSDVTVNNDLTVGGNLTVQGTTTTLSTTNSVVSDSLIELNSGAGSNANDLGLIFERGSTGDNAVFAWDESADKFTLGTTTATGASTGDLTISAGTLVAALEGNADTATALETARTISLSGDVAGSVSFDGTGNVDITTTIQADSVALGTDTTGNYVQSIADAGSSQFTITNGTAEGGAATIALANNAVTLGTHTTGNYVATLADAGNSYFTIANSGSESAAVTIDLVAGAITLGTDTSGDFVGTITGGNGIASTGLTTGEDTDHTLSVDLTDITTFNSDGTVSTAVVLDGSGDFSANMITANLTGDVTGNADTASALATARAIALDGAVTGTANFDGSAGITITTTATSDPTITLAGDLTGSATLTNLGNATLTATIAANSVALGTDTTGNYVDDVVGGAGITVTHTPAEGSDPSVAVDLTDTNVFTSTNTASKAVVRDGSGNFAAGTGTFSNIDGILGANTAAAASVTTLSASGLAQLDGGMDVDGAFVVANTTGNITTTGTAIIGSATATTDVTLKVDATDSMLLPAGTTGERPDTGVTGMFRYNTTTNQIEYYSNTAWTSVSADFTLATSQTFNGDNSTVAFTLSALSGADSYTVAGVLVMLNGVVQEPTTVYGISGTTLTFTTAPASGDLIEVRKFTTTSTVVALSDSDGDTLVQVEESSDEDVIRFDIAGTEKMYLNSTGLAVAGNLHATGTITADGDITLGDASSDSVTFTAKVGSNIIPTTDSTYDLGTSDFRWADIYADSLNGVLTLPTADGTSGQALVTDGAGTLSFGAAGATISSDTSTNTNFQLYFDSLTSGALTTVKQDSGLTYNPSTGTLAADNFSGSAATLTTARAIELSGAVTGTANFDGSAAINIVTTATADPTLTLAGDLSGSATFTNLGNATLTATIAANSVALGTDTTGNYVGAGAVSGTGLSGSLSAEGGTFTVTSNATSSNTGGTIVARDGSGNFSAGTVTATATSAQYADLAEMYAADAEIEPGTVVHFAGEGKLAACDTENCRTVAGIVSTDPAHLMNASQEGVALALAGRVPCKVTGVVNAGDLMVSAGNGMAMANNNATIGTVIGKAIEANEGGEGVIEVLALMM